MDINLYIKVEKYIAFNSRSCLAGSTFSGDKNFVCPRYLAHTLKPPPSDQLWYGFTSMPDLEWDLESSIGDRKITNSHIASLIGNRFMVLNIALPLNTLFLW